MEIIKNYLTISKYTRPGKKLENPTAIVWHYVANPKSTALANRNYFESLKNGIKDKNGNYIYASSHYIIGLQGEIIQCIPENEISYATEIANSYTISVEFCHTDITGKPNQETYNSMIWLAKDIIKRNPNIKNHIRHYDVTGKICPKWFVDNTKEWENFKRNANESEEEEMLEELINKYGKEKVKNALDKMVQSLNSDNNPSNWAKEEYQEAIKLNITDGTRPKMYSTREETAIMIKRAFEQII